MLGKKVLLYMWIKIWSIQRTEQSCKKWKEGQDFFVIKPSRCTDFTNLFCHETVHVSDSSSVHHQEFIHCTVSNGIRYTGL